MKALKFAICLAVTLFCVSAPFCALAATVSDEAAGINLSLPEDYTVFTVDNIRENTEAASRLGLSADYLSDQMKSSGMIMVALNDKGDQVQLKKIKTDFSEGVGDLAALEKDTLSDIGKMIMTDFTVTYSADGTPCFESSGGGYGYGSVRYVTVKNGWLITLSYYGNSADAAKEAFSGLSFGRSGGGYSVNDIILSVVMMAVIIAAVAIVIYIVYSFIRDARVQENDVAPYIRIKRRKF